MYNWQANYIVLRWRRSFEFGMTRGWDIFFFGWTVSLRSFSFLQYAKCTVYAGIIHYITLLMSVIIFAKLMYSSDMSDFCNASGKRPSPAFSGRPESRNLRPIGRQWYTLMMCVCACLLFIVPTCNITLELIRQKCLWKA